MQISADCRLGFCLAMLFLILLGKQAAAAILMEGNVLLYSTQTVLTS
jgi:hypothetical protein